MWAGLWSRLGRLAVLLLGPAVRRTHVAVVLASVPCGLCAMRRAVGSLMFGSHRAMRRVLCSQPFYDALAFNQALGDWNVASATDLSTV